MSVPPLIEWIKDFEFNFLFINLNVLGLRGDPVDIKHFKFSKILVFLFLKLTLTKRPYNFEETIKKHLKSTLSPRHVPWRTYVIKDIPRTKSGKNSEILVKKIINNDKVQNLGALANPESVQEYKSLKIK